MADVFYAEGLRFSCARCSGCCRGEAGYVFLSKEDLIRLLRRLSLDFKRFFQEYCTLVDTGTGMALSLRDVARSEKGGKASFDCALWGEEGCSVYEDRPVQCRTYPFWASIVEDDASWRREARSCPGMGSGELRSRAYIEERLLARRGAGTLVLSYGVDPECADEATILGS
jgi:Fe-S-cluster containining protein